MVICYVFREDTARSAVSARIKYIHDVILKENDPLLYNQLNLLDIQPTSYGMYVRHCFTSTINAKNLDAGFGYYMEGNLL